MTSQDYEMERAFGWDDEIEEDSAEFVLLPEGEYNFLIKYFERAHYDGGEKMIACPMAKITFEVTNPATGKLVMITENLFLNSKQEWKLSAFFASIGQKKRGERVRMNWNAVVGATGRFELNHREYKNNAGDMVKTNNIKKFFPRDYTGSQPQAVPQQQQPYQQQPNTQQYQQQQYQQPQQSPQQPQQQSTQAPTQQQMTGYTPGSF